MDEVLRAAVGANPCVYVAAVLMSSEHSDQFSLPDGAGLGSALAELVSGASSEGHEDLRKKNSRLMDKIQRLSQPPFHKGVAEWALCMHRLALLVQSCPGHTAAAMAAALLAHVGTVLALALDPAKSPTRHALEGGPEAVWVEYDRIVRIRVETAAAARAHQPMRPLLGFDAFAWNHAAMAVAGGAVKARGPGGPGSAKALLPSKMLSLSSTTPQPRALATSRAGSSKPKSAAPAGPSGFCFDFNTHGCERDRCKFRHICLSCHGPHAVGACPKAGKAGKAAAAPAPADGAESE